MQNTLKPWGEETIIFNEESVTLKRIRIMAGEQLSLQYHKEKAELLCCVKGIATVINGRLTKTYTKGDYFYVHPYRNHRISAITECEFIEMSVGDDLDIIRLEDSYGRVK